jgi:DNA repair ATPase RecN
VVVESDPSQLTQLIINGIRLSVTTLTSIGALGRVKEILSKKKNKLRKLSSYTDKAFNELSNILDDVAIHYKAIDNSLDKLEALSLDNNDVAMRESRRVLSDILAGKVRRNLKDARLRCDDIYKAWEEDKPSLHDWFATLYKKSYLKDSELQEIESTFSSLSNSDGAYVRSIESITNYAENKASIILKLVDSNDISNAKIEVKKIKDDLAEHRQHLSRELGDLTKKGYGAIKTKSTEIKPKVFYDTIWKRFRRLFSK